MEYGITPEGFKIMTFEDIINKSYSELSALTKSISNPASTDSLLTLSTRDTSDPFYQMELKDALMFAEVWQVMESLYNGFNLYSAVGELLDSIASVGGRYRKIGSYSTINLTFTGVPNSPIPVGTKISNLDGTIVFFTTEPLFITTQDNKVTGNAQCTLRGAIDVEPETLTTFVMQIPGVTNVTNGAKCSFIGEEDEQDEEFRARISLGTSSLGDGRAENIDTYITSSITGVKYCKTYVSTASNTPVQGVPSGYVCSVVDCSADLYQKVAEGIFDAGGLYLNYYGNVSKTVKDRNGVEYVVKFQTPLSQLIIVSLNVTTINSSFWTEADTQVIKDNVAKYVAENGSIGSLMLSSKIYQYVANQPNISISSITIGTKTGSFGDMGASYQLNWQSYATINEENILISFG